MFFKFLHHKWCKFPKVSVCWSTFHKPASTHEPLKCQQKCIRSNSNCKWTALGAKHTNTYDLYGGLPRIRHVVLKGPQKSTPQIFKGRRARSLSNGKFPMICVKSWGLHRKQRMQERTVRRQTSCALTNHIFSRNRLTNARGPAWQFVTCRY